MHDLFASEKSATYMKYVSCELLNRATPQFIVIANIKVQVEPMRQLNLKADPDQILLGRLRHIDDESPGKANKEVL